MAESLFVHRPAEFSASEGFRVVVHVLAYHLKRVIQIFGVAPLLAAMRA